MKATAKKVKRNKSDGNAAAEIAAIQARLKVGKTKYPKKTFFASWSFSRYSDYKQCPLKAKLKHLEKIEEPPNAAMARGADIGRLAELFIKGSLTKLPEELKKFENTFKALAKQFKQKPGSMVVEDQWAFDKAWGKSKWNDWDNCVVRVKVDAGHLTGPKTMRIIDWKTGKYSAHKREEYVEQLELYALSALLLNEQVQEVETFLAYLDAGIFFPEPDTADAKSLKFTRADIPRLKKTWDKRTRAMLLDRAFAPRPNDKCQWCHYRKDNKAAMPGGKALCKF